MNATINGGVIALGPGPGPVQLAHKISITLYHALNLTE
jgi:hypothetical protein